jgi:DNA repair protein RecN (Recombination protein N)
LEVADEHLRKLSLNEIAQIDTTQQPQKEAVDDLLCRAEDLHQHLQRYAERMEFDPQRLQEVEDRLHLIQMAKKKYGGTLESVLQKQQQLKEALALIDDNGPGMEVLQETVTQAEKSFLDLAKTLSIKRDQHAKTFEKKLIQELAELAMPKTQFQIVFQKVAPSEHGIDQIEFLISANPGQPLRPLAKIASGGEISRIMLALKTLLAESDPVETMVFDEIDVGIGGKTALSVAEKLAKLSQFRQVICITHLPQIAAKAESHFVVEKVHGKTMTTVTVAPLSGEPRQSEIARMLSGEVTETTLKHAGELLG